MTRPQPPRITPPFNWRHDLESSFAEQRAGTTCTCDGDRCTWEPGGTQHKRWVTGDPALPRQRSSDDDR